MKNVGNPPVLRNPARTLIVWGNCDGCTLNRLDAVSFFSSEQDTLHLVFISAIVVAMVLMMSRTAYRLVFETRAELSSKPIVGLQIVASATFKSYS